MKKLPDRVLSHPGSEVPSRVEASSQGREIRLHEPRFLEAATERADSTVKPLRVEPVAYLCTTNVENVFGLRRFLGSMARQQRLRIDLSQA